MTMMIRMMNVRVMIDLYTATTYLAAGPSLYNGEHVLVALGFGWEEVLGEVQMRGGGVGALQAAACALAWRAGGWRAVWMGTGRGMRCRRLEEACRAGTAARALCILCYNFKRYINAHLLKGLR